MRRNNRLDYRELNISGKKVFKNDIDEIVKQLESIQVNDISMDEKKIVSLQIDQSTLQSDITDFIEENDLNGMLHNAEDLDANISRLETMRSKYRNLHNQLAELMDEDKYETKFSKETDQTLSGIKLYIKDAKYIKGVIRSNKQKSNALRLSDVNSTLESLAEEFGKENYDVTDNELLRRKEELPANLKRFDSLSSKMIGIIDNAFVCSRADEKVIDKITEKYNQLLTNKEEYLRYMNDELNDRELSKHQIFKESKLNIKLSKFKGYDSELDIYTFQSEFNKIYQRTTPKRIIADLLKNNLLEGPALCLVKSVEDIEEIWRRLKTAYGNSRILLQRKLNDINKVSLFRIKEPEKLIESLSKITNAMRDLMKLAKTHNIESRLYSGDTLERIYNLIGDQRVTRWLLSNNDDVLEDEELWTKFIGFLEKEIRVQQQRVFIQTSTSQITEAKRDVSSKSRASHHTVQSVEECVLCGKNDHVTTNGPNGTRLIQYYSCKMFAEMTPNERFLLLKKKELCIQCLYPGARQDDYKHRDGKCQRDFICKHQSHERFNMRKHVLVCQEHSSDDSNKSTLERYKSKCIKNPNLPGYAKNIKLSFHSLKSCSYKSSSQHTDKDNDIISEHAVYILQTIKVDDDKFNLFFDTGCNEMVSKYDAVKRIGYRSKQEHPGPIVLGGVGNVRTESPHGIFAIKLPLHNGNEAVLAGVCLDQITAKFPTYPLQGEVENDIRRCYKKTGGDINKLPILPKTVGGETDFMIGAKYLRYYPKPIFQMPSGLTIYESVFKNADGSRGVVGGPHEVFTRIEKSHWSSKEKEMFLSQQHQIFNNGYFADLDTSMFNIKHSKDHFRDSIIPDSTIMTARKEKSFYEVEDAGSNITFRCIKCRTCKDCKHQISNEIVSFREEVEQNEINKSVEIDLSNRMTIAKLPLIHNPLTKLSNNKNIALKVFNQQVKKLNRCPSDLHDVILSENKLQELGHVDYVTNLSTEQQLMLQNNPIQNFIPWRAVWNGNSVSTPCRLVFDASQSTSSGYSLNDLLAKGKNNMNKLVEIIIRWSIHKVAFHTDIKKMYNSVKLRQEDWCMQRYIWQDELDPTKIPVEKIIKTLIYGVKCSGNQAERGLRMTAELSKSEYPEVKEIIDNDIYVDDCLSGGRSEEEVLKRSDEIELVLNRGGYSLKGVTISNKPPTKKLSIDGESINVAGMKWFPKEDFLSLDISELNFAKKVRGKKPLSTVRVVPERLTRRHCVSKIAEIYDLTGKITPITACMKIDLHELILRKLDWDDRIPDDLRHTWQSHFDMMNEINTIKFNRAIIPEDAIDTNITTIDSGDASKSIACSTVHARFKRKNGEYSCQLVFSRSKLVPDNMTQPRAELFAAVINVHTGMVVKRAFGEYHKSALKLTDSQIVLHWINSKEKPLKQWVRNRIIEIRRFTSTDDWRYVQSKDMIADIATRKGATIDDVKQNSVWMNGFSWMKLEADMFPVKTIDEIKSSCLDVDVTKEATIIDGTSDSLQQVFINQDITQRNIPYDVSERYKFSNYLIDPNKHKFETVIRIMAYVIRFIQKLKKTMQTTQPNVNLTEQEISDAKMYFYQKATAEIKKFVNLKKYENISRERNGVLYFTGRMLPTQEIQPVANMTDVMKDLIPTSFCVPIVDKHSPIAYSIINQVHWYDEIANHKGVETVTRQILKLVYILEGRELIKKFGKMCKRCRFLNKKYIDVVMGNISQHSLTIAPSFYITQVDLAGPFKAFSNHNKRATIKIWMCVFCCTTTSTTSIKIMDDYTTASFIMSFIRLSCEVGYPKLLLADKGSQLIKGCKTVRIDFRDLQNRLHKEKAVEFDTCPVGGHNMHGKVERRIREIKKSIEKSTQNQRLSILQWETLAAEIANTINNLPLALRNITSSFESMDLLTPNRLRLGRNNDRSPTQPLYVSNSMERFLEENKKIVSSWFECWLTAHVPKLIEQPKWFKNDRDVKVGDVILMLKQEMSSDYQYGIIHEVLPNTDNKIRKVKIKYRNHTECVDRFTTRATRSLVIIHPVDELDLLQELGEIANIASLKLCT